MLRQAGESQSGNTTQITGMVWLDTSTIDAAA